VLLHLFQLSEMAIPTLAAIFLEIKTLIIGVMIGCLLLHETTAIWDVSYLEELVRGLRRRGMAHGLALRLMPAQFRGTRVQVEKERSP